MSDVSTQDSGGCEWFEDDPDYGVWQTACGNAFCFEADGPAENEFKFCPYCGGTLTEFQKDKAP